MPEPLDAASTFRYELRSAEQLDALARAPLPLGIAASEARRTTHRDLYLDTPDDALRRRGVSCRLRVGADGETHLTLRIAANGAPSVHVDVAVNGDDPSSAVAADNEASRRLRAMVDVAQLAPRVECEVERLTRTAHPDLLRRPRLSIHYDTVTVRRGDVAQVAHRLCGHLRRGSAQELVRLAMALEREHGLYALSADPRDHAEQLGRRLQRPLQLPAIDPEDAADDGWRGDLLCPELSLLAFQRRVLALAESDATPLRERLRFLGIVTANLDELYMVRMAGLRRAALDDDSARHAEDDGLVPLERLTRVEKEVASILAAQARCAERCLADAERHGVRLVGWDLLTEVEREALATRCRDEIQPGLTPFAMTLSPGHPLPHLPHLGLSLAVVFRAPTDDRPRLAEVELPEDAPRLMEVPGRRGVVIAIEEVLRANVAMLHPNTDVEGAYLLRVTRGGDLGLDEAGAGDLLDAVASATGRRPLNPAVRVEVERAMPDAVRRLVLENLRREATELGTAEPVDHVQVVDGLLDLRCLASLPLPPDRALEYPALHARSPVGDGSMLDQVRDAELLVHHPFDGWDATVARFVRDAAADRAVTGIRITLYRVGDSSPVVDSLVAAARAGKRVVALVELKARFDEEHNVGWARALEQAGGHVVYGLVGYKVHAKVALVVRREGERLRRYVHVGTGNYSARSGRQYTDLSLFSARDDLGEDVADLFNELTGSSRPPQGLRHGALVAPHQLLPAVLAMIERETAHARAGREAHIAIKVNGLSDPDVVRALYRASEAGVKVDLVVRGICTLRPGVEGLSPGVRVVSVVGRFLEHSRVYRFANGGEGEYFIGSSDLRPRNLRRRVELLVPVVDAGQRVELDRVLELYLEDPTGWELGASGAYRQRAGDGAGAQESLMRG